MKTTHLRRFKALAVSAAAALALSGCGFNPYSLPYPGGADTGDNPIKIKAEFRDVLDLVPQSAVRVNDIPVGKVDKIKLNGWTAVLELKLNRDAELPANAVASIRQTSLLGEKFVAIEAPETGSVGRLKNGDLIPLSRTGRNPEIEEVLGAASLLFNGGGLEKTRTIVRELNNTLDGNETEVKELLRSANSFVTQLDNNKEGLLTSLEKVNRLAIEANNQKAAITGALDSLPEALTTLDQQRGDLVKLLEALDRLGDVGTRVVRESKVDTVAQLRDLVPILRNLANSGDDLSKSLTTLLTFPFNDATVGGPTVQGAKDFQYGDFFNLSLRADVSLEQLAGLLGLQLPSGDAAAATDGTGVPAGDPVGDLADLVGGLVPDLTEGGIGGLIPGATPAPSSTSSSSTPTPAPAPSGDPQLPGFCSLLGQCRTAPSNLVDDVVQSDLGRLLIEPVVVS